MPPGFFVAPPVRRVAAALAASVAAGLTAVPTGPVLFAQPAAPAGAAHTATDTTAAVRWNVLGRRLWRDAAAARATNAPNAGLAVRMGVERVLLLESVAQDDAARAAADSHLARVAVAAASAAVLAAQLPDSAGRAAVAQERARDVAAAARTLGAARADAGAALGDRAAARLLAWARGDGSDAVWRGTVPVGPGMWTSAAGAQPGAAARPTWRPWAIARADQFRPAPPPAYGSPAFAEALGEVRQVARTRTPAQTRLAQYFAREPLFDLWFAEGAGRVHAARPAEGDAARAFALAGVAAYDAGIACWEAKYHYWLLRPSMADTTIAFADSVPLPNFPSYPSGHACGSGAFAAVFGAFVPAARADLEALADSAAVSRLYAGVHYRFDDDAGLALGRAVGRYVLDADRAGRLGAWRTAPEVGNETVPGGAPRLGALTFPTSAAPAARAEFVRGVLYLHNFHYPQARTAFARARALDPGDGMSAAFEALASTAPVWNQQDTAAARAALRAFAPTRAARLARAPRERAWADAVEALYDGNTPKPGRDTAFSRALGRLHAADPRDLEAAAFYALSLLGLNQGDREPAAYARAEAVADTVLRAHPRHPGALHYKIHAVDDPANAARGLAAARLYGDVAPDAGHALHMTSHIHLALGRWDDVVRANRMAAATSPHVFGHGTHWLVYGLVQQGRPQEARGWVDSMRTYARQVAAGGPAARGRVDAAVHAVLIPATWIVDAEAWDAPLARVHPDTADLRGAGVAVRSTADFLVGYAASRRAGRPVDVVPGSRAADWLVADSMLARMAARHAAARAALGTARGPDATDLGQAAVMEATLRAELLATTQLADVRAAIAAVRARPDVDPARVVVAGASYGGILTLLAAEADSTLRAAVAFAPAAMNWAWNAPLRERLTAAARRTRVPALVLQAENDWNVGPTTAIPAAMRAGGGDATGRLYPAVGQNVGEGHGLIVTAPSLWQDDVFAFLARHLGDGGPGRTAAGPR